MKRWHFISRNRKESQTRLCLSNNEFLHKKKQTTLSQQEKMVVTCINSLCDVMFSKIFLQGRNYKGTFSQGLGMFSCQAHIYSLTLSSLPDDKIWFNQMYLQTTKYMRLNS